MVGKDNWSGFLDAIYSKWRLFLPILSPFSPLPQLLPPPPPLHSSSSGKELPIFPFLPFFPSPSILHSNVKYGLTSSVWLRGRLPVNCKFWPTLQFIWNGKSGKAIYWKWGASLNFPPLKKFVFSHHVGSKEPYRNISSVLLMKYNSGKQDWLWFASSFLWVCIRRRWESEYPCSHITSICEELLLPTKPVHRDHAINLWIYLLYMEGHRRNVQIVKCVGAWSIGQTTHSERQEYTCPN